MWGNWITIPVILEWHFQMSLLLVLAFFSSPEENYLFCGESPSFSWRHCNRHVWKVLSLQEWFLPTMWWQFASVSFLFFSELSGVTLSFSAETQISLWRFLLFSVFVRETRKGETTLLRIPFRIQIPQDLTLVWPISPLNYYPPPREVNQGISWLSVSYSVLRALGFHHR